MDVNAPNGRYFIKKDVEHPGDIPFMDGHFSLVTSLSGPLRSLSGVGELDVQLRAEGGLTAMEVIGDTIETTVDAAHILKEVIRVMARNARFICYPALDAVPDDLARELVKEGIRVTHKRFDQDRLDRRSREYYTAFTRLYGERPIGSFMAITTIKKTR